MQNTHSVSCNKTTMQVVLQHNSHISIIITIVNAQN